MLSSGGKERAVEPVQSAAEAVAKKKAASTRSTHGGDKREGGGIGRRDTLSWILINNRLFPI